VRDVIRIGRRHGNHEVLGFGRRKLGRQVEIRVESGEIRGMPKFVDGKLVKFSG
jgi:hypothetical protein